MPRADAPLLALLNGPPGAGKSTLAAALAAEHPQLRAVDVDAIKHDLPAWPHDPHAAGLAARARALDEAGEHLRAGRGVVLPQLLARPEFALALADLAERTGARFVHVVLVLPDEALRERLASRRAAPTRPEQALNDAGLAIEDALALARRISAMVAQLDPVRRVDATGPLPLVRARLERELGLSD